MAEASRQRRAKVANRTVRPRRPARTHANPHDVPSGVPPAVPPRAALDAARRVGESFLVAIVTSTGLYLVGMVYIGSYYGRMSIEATALDFAPPYITLQAIHVLPGLLEYPSTLLLFWILYRTFHRPARRLAVLLDGGRRRFPRLGPIVANLVVIAPLLVGALLASIREQTTSPDSVLAEVASLLENASVVLLVYAIWLGWSQRAYLVTLVRARKVLPIALVFLVYLLNALATTSIVAENAASVLMTGRSDNSMRIILTPKPGETPAWGNRELVLVTLRQSTYFVRDRHPGRPGLRPTAWLIRRCWVAAAGGGRFPAPDALFDAIDVTID